MKYINFLILLTALVFLSACNGSNAENTNNTEALETVSEDTTHEITATQPTETITIGIADLEPIPHIFRDMNRYVNRVTLIDLATGENIAIHEFDEYDAVEQVWDLGNGYYAIWVGHEELFNREIRLRRLDGNMDSDGVDAEFMSPSERNLRLAILDENLNYLESLQIEGYFLPIFATLRFAEGEMFSYGWRPNDTLTFDFIRMNLHKGEREVLFTRDSPLNLRSFIEDNKILVDSMGEMGVYPYRAYYGILDLTTGDAELFDREYFHVRSVVPRDGKVMFSEFDNRMSDRELLNEVIIFDLETEIGEVVQLGHEDSIWARLSFDGNHIVTVNQRDFVFRKYNMDGDIIAEVPLTSPLPDNIFDIAIFPVTDRIYTIHTIEHMRDRHIQFIELP